MVSKQLVNIIAITIEMLQTNKTNPSLNCVRGENYIACICLHVKYLLSTKLKI